MTTKTLKKIEDGVTNTVWGVIITGMALLLCGVISDSGADTTPF